MSAEAFAKMLDGYSIGSNVLTHLTLGVDRDSEIVAQLFDERNEVVKPLIRMAIAAAIQTGRKIGICSQAPSDDPACAQFLVEQGIESLSLNPDVVRKTTIQVIELERTLGRSA